MRYKCKRIQKGLSDILDVKGESLGDWVKWSSKLRPRTQMQWLVCGESIF